MNHSRLLSLLAVATASAIGLAGCYVVPLDLRTGQPYAQPTSTVQAGNVGTLNPMIVAPPQPTMLGVRLYPVNDQANKGGLLSAVVTDNNAGHGSFSVPYLGDTLQGESTRVDAGYAAFGRIHNDVLGISPRAFTGRRGVANAHGAKGVNAQCEYVLTGPGSGTGACAFSDGAKYQMHFGG